MKCLLQLTPFPPAYSLMPMNVQAYAETFPLAGLSFMGLSIAIFKRPNGVEQGIGHGEVGRLSGEEVRIKDLA